MNLKRLRAKWRRFTLVIMALVLGVGMSLVSLNTANAATHKQVIEAPQAPIAAKAGIAIEAESGQILAAKNIDVQLPMASITKMLSLYLVLQAVKKGEITWSQKVTPASWLVKLSHNMELSNIPFEADKAYTVEELYQASWVYSSNAAVMTLADLVSGSQNEFVDAMHAQLKSWGASDYTIVNASGVSNTYLGDHRYPDTAADAENSMRARDIALVAQHLLKDYPEVLDDTAKTSLDFHGTTYPTWNFMLNGENDAQKELPVDGLKTGTSDKAGQSFVGTVKKQGFRIITVILNASGQADDESKRFTATGNLMNSVYANWQRKTIVRANQTSKLLKTVKVDNSKQTKVKVMPAETLHLMLPKSTKAEQLHLAINTAKYSQTAPLAKGEQIGSLVLPQVGYGYLEAKQAPSIAILSTEKVAGLNWFQKVWRNISNVFHK